MTQKARNFPGGPSAYLQQKGSAVNTLLVIEARELQVGDAIVRGNGKSDITVKSIERGPSCTGVHLNVVRRDTRVIRNRQKQIVGLNADRGAIIYSDGCWQPCHELIVRRTPLVDA